MRIRDRSSILVVSLLAAAFLVAGLMSRPASAGARNPCKESGNLTYNCGFDNFVAQTWNGKQLQVPEGWWYFILDGDLDYRTSIDTYWGAPSLWMVSDGVPFIAGIYQQVAVTPGVVYQTDIGWAAQDKPDFERKLGLDPAGGTNPNAPTVVWSRSEIGFDKWPDLTVSARATGPTMTVFVWVAHRTTHGVDSLFLDAVGLWPDPNQPAATVTPKPSPTPTSLPTRKPAAIRPSATPIPPSSTPTPTETPTAVPTETPTPTPTPTWTITPSPLPPTLTPTPSQTPTMTPVPVAKLLPPAEARPAMGGARAVRPGRQSGIVFLYVAAGALLIGLVLSAVALGLVLRPSRHQVTEQPDVVDPESLQGIDR